MNFLIIYFHFISLLFSLLYPNDSQASFSETFPQHLALNSGNSSSRQLSPCRWKTRQARKSNPSVNNFIWGNRVCDFDRVSYCNEHFREHRCICYVPAELLDSAAKSKVPCCPELLRVDSLEYLVLTIGIAFPVPKQFLGEADSVFTEDLEFYTSINRNSIIIARKGCTPDKKIFEFQFAVTKAYRNPRERRRSLTQYDLEYIYPSMFKSNLNFMQKNALIIKYVQQSNTFRPLIGYPEWIAGNTTRPSKLGRCAVFTKDPQYDCFFYELGAFFVASIYLGAGISFWLTTGLMTACGLARRRRRRAAALETAIEAIELAPSADANDAAENRRAARSRGRAARTPLHRSDVIVI